MWLVAKNSFLLSPDLTLIILYIVLRNLRVLGSIGPRTSIHIGTNSIEGRAFPYFFIFSSAALAAAKPHSLLVRFTYRSANDDNTDDENTDDDITDGDNTDDENTNDESTDDENTDDENTDDENRDDDGDDAVERYKFRVSRLVVIVLPLYCLGQTRKLSQSVHSSA
ncbi:hypothetical protein HELRODRAFT_164536 [Helobdella robusta]|uniref:Uncharacterized protein n=1 Tax=Helobdella robusta TaxID=6412 RepID=T1EVJ8_HELRO|nr:hypothetical protein HELRODRAFT_164536 [Helobdella robusta]ESN94657.1 hypothetical protein HELRODRAFT_164536 [Helobdella robusta]